MNFKKTALVLAMAGIVAAPMAVQAGSTGDGAYASIRVGLQSSESAGGEGVAGGSESTTIGGYASRFGFKSESDLGNGMTGFGQYEFQVGTEQNSFAADASNTIRVRKAFVGIKGDFGSINMGSGYETFYKHSVGVNDNPWAGSGYAMVAYRGRTTNNLTYAGSAGPVSYGITLQMDGTATDASGNQETMDATELGLSFDAGFGTLSIATLNNKGALGTDADVLGAALSGVAVGPVTLGVGYQQGETSGSTVEPTSTVFDAGFAGAYLHLEALDADGVSGAGDVDMTTIGYTLSLGPQTSMWFEYKDVDAAGGNAGDDTDMRAIFKYDI